MRNREYWIEEWNVIKRWSLPVAGMLLGGIVPLAGFFISLMGYFLTYPLWKAEPAAHRNLKVFSTLALILSFITMMGLIYLSVSGILDNSSISQSALPS